MKSYSLALFSFIVFMTSCSLAATPEQKKDLELSGKVKNGIRVIEVKASKYKFNPDPIVVKLGERVRVLATSGDVAHGFAIAEFKINAVIYPGKTAAIEFLADRAGEFVVYCSVYCGPGHKEMRGKFIVRK